jgi:hypothetical protein
MTNVEIADEIVETLRGIIAESTTEAVPIKVETLLDALGCLERLAILERHLVNLVSSSYEEQQDTLKVDDVTNIK